MSNDVILSAQSGAAIIIPELSGAKIRQTPDGCFSVYDLIRICAGVQNPRELWLGRHRKKKDGTEGSPGLVSRYPDIVDNVYSFKFQGKGQKETPVANLEGCLRIIGVLPGECGKSYRESAAKLVRRYIEGDSDLGAEIMIRDHNKQRFERAKKRLLVCETNKQTSDIATQHGVNPAYIHSDRYRGLYRKTTSQLRKDAGLKKTETPLNAMSVRDLTMNSLVNQLVAESGDPTLAFNFGDGIRETFEKTMKKPLAPIWEKKQLRPNQARKMIAVGQLELPVEEGETTALLAR